jgi:hypothetical protein
MVVFRNVRLPFVFCRLETAQVSFVFYIVLFFGLALLFGHVIRVTGIFDVVHWGRLTFIKPETMRGFFFAGPSTRSKSSEDFSLGASIGSMFMAMFK